MKRVVAGVLAGVLLLGAGGGAWWFVHRNGLAVRPAAYLPPDTVFYTEIPDGTKTFLRYQGSRLRQIVEHPEARQIAGGLAAVLDRAMPADALDPQAASHLEKAGSEFGLALGGTSFFAVTKLDVAPPAKGAASFTAADAPALLAGVGAVGGFHGSPDGGSHVDALVRELGALWKAAPQPVAATRGTVAYTYVEIPQAGVRLCRARWKEWDLFSFGEAPLFDFLDRASGASSGPSLRDAADFAATVPKVGADADVAAYCRLETLWSLYGRWISSLTPGTNMGPIFDQFRFMKAAAEGVSFRAGEIVQRAVVLAPAAERGVLAASFQPIPLASLRFTTPDTLLYIAQPFDPEVQYDLQKQISAPGAAAAASPFDMIEKQVAAQGLDLHENFLRATGPEMAVIVDWPAAQPVPDVLFLLAVKDAAKFGPFYDKYAALASSSLGGLGKVESFQVAGNGGNGYKAVSVAPAMAAWASPTLFGGADFWGLSLTAGGAKRLLAAPGGGLAAASFAGKETPPGKVYAAACLKTGEVVSRSYAAARPALAAWLGKTDAGRAIVEKLPAQPQLAPLLGEMRGTATLDGDFLYHTSTSPDGGLALVGGGVAALEAVVAARAPVVPPAPAPVAAPVPAPVP